MQGMWHGYFGGGTDEKPHVTWALLRRVLGYARPYRWAIVGMLAAILTNTGLGLLTPLILRDLVDRTLPARDTDRLNLLAVGLILIPLLSGAVGVVERWLNARIGEGVIYDLRVNLYAHLQRMSLRFFTHTRTGELMSRLNNDVIGAQRAISNTVVDLLTNLIQAGAALGVMLTLEWRLTILSVAVLPLFIMAARRLGGILRDIAREAMTHNAEMSAMMNETLNIGGVLLVKLFGRQRDEVNRFGSRAARVRNIGIHRAVVGRQLFVVIGLVSAIGMALVYWVGGHLVLNGTFTIGTIVAFTAYLGQLYGALQSLTNAPVDFSASLVSFERVFEVVDLPVEIEEKHGAVELHSVQGELIFDRVTFTYQDQQGPLLREVERYGQMDSVRAVLSGNETRKSEDGSPPPTDSQARQTALESISFVIRPGQLAALVGPSGAGKTTLTYLIPRLYDPSAGRILIDGHDLRDVTIASLSAQIGMVTQDTHLFHDTIRMNLLYARLDAMQTELEQAARAANIHDFIAGLPDGYDTIVGERGYRLSGGEKQRIAIARVILKDPRILVLDEATSHLDSHSEALIQNALKTVMAGRTSIVIAHRLSTILAADTILVMDRGRIVEQGVHADLLEQNGLYASLYRTQFSRDIALY